MHVLTVLAFAVADQRKIVKRCIHGRGKPNPGVHDCVDLVDLNVNRIFRICYVTDLEGILMTDIFWSDLAKLEAVLVIESQTLLDSGSEGKEFAIPSGALREPWL